MGFDVIMRAPRPSKYIKTPRACCAVTWPCSAVPAGGLDVILRHAQAVAVQESEGVLRGGGVAR